MVCEQTHSSSQNKTKQNNKNKGEKGKLFRFLTLFLFPNTLFLNKRSMQA